MQAIKQEIRVAIASLPRSAPGILKYIQGRIIGLLLFFMSVPLVAQVQNLDFFIAKGLRHSPRLKGQAHQTESLKYSYHKESIFKKNPVFSFGYENIPESTWPARDQHQTSGINLSLSQTLAFPWESSSRKEGFYKQYLSQEQRLADAKRSLVRDISLVYHLLHFLHTKGSSLKENKKTLREIVKVSRALVRVNKLNSAQLLKLEADLAVMQNRILLVQANIQEGRAMMERLCGLSIRWSKRTWNDKTAAKAKHVAGRPWQQKSTDMKVPNRFDLKKHPLWRQMQLTYEAAKADLALAKARLLPDITLSASYRLRQEIPDRDAGENFISFRASFPLPLYYPLKERHSIAAKEARLLALHEELKEIKLTLEKSWQGQRANTRGLLAAYQNFEQELMPRYFAAYKAQLSVLASGGASLLDVLDTYRQYLELSIKQAELYRDLKQSIAKLEYLSMTDS